MSPDSEISAEDVVLQLLELSMMRGIPIHTRPDGLPGWTFVQGIHGYPIAFRTP